MVAVSCTRAISLRPSSFLGQRPSRLGQRAVLLSASAPLPSLPLRPASAMASTSAFDITGVAAGGAAGAAGGTAGAASAGPAGAVSAGAKAAAVTAAAQGQGGAWAAPGAAGVPGQRPALMVPMPPLRAESPAWSGLPAPASIADVRAGLKRNRDMLEALDSSLVAASALAPASARIRHALAWIATTSEPWLEASVLNCKHKTI